MSFTITEAMVRQFDTQIRLEAGQNSTRLLGCVTDRGMITGDSFTANMLEDDGGELDENNTRHGDTIWSDATHLTPIATMRDFFKAYPVDRADEPKIIANPSGSYMNLLLRARERRIDKIIYDAARGTQTLRDATTEALPSGQKIAHGSTGFTKAKIIQAKKMFRAVECDEHNGEELFMIYTSQMLEDVLGDTTLTSIDHLAVKMLQEGDISGKWCGFKWIPYESIYNASSVYYTVAFAKSAIQFGTGFEEGDMSRRKDKKNTMQVSMAASYGALRTQAEKVVEIAFQ